jgi:hypothetical protein
LEISGELLVPYDVSPRRETAVLVVQEAGGRVGIDLLVKDVFALSEK